MSFILIVINDPIYFLSHRLPIAEAARDKGYVVHVASIASPSVEKIRVLGFEYHELPLNRGGVNPFGELYSLYAFWRLLQKLRPDILHLVTTKPVLYGGIAARFSPVKGVVAAIAGLGSVFVSSGFKYSLIRLIVCRMYCLALGKNNLRAVFQNPDDRDSLVRLGALTADKTILIRGSGVQLSNYAVRPEPLGKTVVTFAGRLLRDKGVGEFVRAAKLLNARGVEAVFQLVGDADPGNPSSLTTSELAEVRDGNDVVLMGYRDDIADIFASSNLVVLPSYREGLPKALIEAAACGRAVVTTDVPGCRDAIRPNITGLLVPVRDAEALAVAIEKLINDPELRQRMGSAGRALAEQAFTIENVVGQHMDIYATLESNS